MQIYRRNECKKEGRLGVSSLGDKKFLFLLGFALPKMLASCFKGLSLIAVIVKYIYDYGGAGGLVCLFTYSLPIVAKEEDNG